MKIKAIITKEEASELMSKPWPRSGMHFKVDFIDADGCISLIYVEPLKPQVRFEYEKVTLSNVGEFVQEVHDNYGKYYFLNECSGEYQAAEFQDSAYYWMRDNVYRRVEKPVDWVQSVIDDNEDNDDPVLKANLFPGNLNLRIKGVFTKEQAIELAKSILRATGELND